jgi:hypothetical protein
MLFLEDKHAVRALLRALVSAKFSPDPYDRDVPTSPLVANIAREAARLLERAEAEREGPIAIERWRAWKDFHPARPEWKTAVKFAAEAFSAHWGLWTSEQREVAISDLVAPYELSATSLEQFLREVEDTMA